MSLDPHPVRQDHPRTAEAVPEPQEPIRTLLWTAATIRPLDEVAALVSLLKRTGEVPSPGDEALRAAAVARPLDEVRQLVVLLNEPPERGEEADTTLRAAAVGRSIEDVARLVSILGTEEVAERPATAEAVRDARPVPVAAAPEALVADEPAGAATLPEPAGTTAAAVSARAGAVPTMPLNPPFVPAAPRRPEPARRASAGRGPGAAAAAALQALRSVLRWPAAAALLAIGLIHLPKDLADLRSGGLADALSVAVTVLCLVLAVWLAVQDSVWLWAASGVAAVGVVVLESMVGFGTASLAGSSLGGSYAWARTTALACAAVVAALAGSALMRRHADRVASGAGTR